MTTYRERHNSGEHEDAARAKHRAARVKAEGSQTENVATPAKAKRASSRSKRSGKR